MAEQIIDPVTLRAYFASVIGGFRQPYGVKRSVPFPANPGAFKTLAQNSTKDRVLSVLVSRSDTGGAANAATFTKNPNGASSNDFAVNFTTIATFRFILLPSESLGLQTSGAAIMQVVVAEESY